MFNKFKETAKPLPPPAKPISNLSAFFSPLTAAKASLSPAPAPAATAAPTPVAKPPPMLVKRSDLWLSAIPAKDSFSAPAQEVIIIDDDFDDDLDDALLAVSGGYVRDAVRVSPPETVKPSVVGSFLHVKPPSKVVAKPKRTYTYEPKPLPVALAPAHAPRKRLSPWEASESLVKSLALKNPRLTAKPTARSSSPTHTTSGGMVLSSEQQAVIELIVKQQLNVFYTGSAGTGKSILLKEVVSQLVRKYGLTAVAVTASTGLAAVNVGGTTIHKWASIGLGKGTPEELAAKVKKAKQVDKWRKTKVLIIDEISMLDGELLNRLHRTAQLVRMNHLPFGGIQLVLTGDFFQLPPVPDRNGPPVQFCFQASCWPTIVQKTVLLTQVFRQRGDLELVDMLNALRFGSVTPAITATFQSLSREVHYDDNILPTELFPTRREVDNANFNRLQRLVGRSFKFTADDSVQFESQANALDAVAPRVLELKVDAQIMMTKNLTDNLVNGSVGTVLYFLSLSVFRKARELYSARRMMEDPEVVADLRLLVDCYGTGPFPPDLERDLGRMVASRKVIVEGLIRLVRMESPVDVVPVVKFVTVNGPELWPGEKVEFSLDGSGGGTGATRLQYPLLLSWALSIHKSQGQTLQRVKVDLAKIFEKGQVYVALSRCVSKESLQVINFNPGKIRAAEEVKTFYEGLERIGQSV